MCLVCQQPFTRTEDYFTEVLDLKCEMVLTWINFITEVMQLDALTNAFFACVVCAKTKNDLQTVEKSHIATTVRIMLA